MYEKKKKKAQARFEPATSGLKSHARAHAATVDDM
jgi:hypothetical protein